MAGASGSAYRPFDAPWGFWPTFGRHLYRLEESSDWQSSRAKGTQRKISSIVAYRYFIPLHVGPQFLPIFGTPNTARIALLFQLPPDMIGVTQPFLHFPSTQGGRGLRPFQISPNMARVSQPLQFFLVIARVAQPFGLAPFSGALLQPSFALTHGLHKSTVSPQLFSGSPRRGRHPSPTFGQCFQRVSKKTLPSLG